MELTSRQREVFDFIRTFVKDQGYPPSVREIGEYFHIYPRAVFDHLKALERKGYLRRRSSMSRGREITVAHRDGRSAVREIPIVGKVAAGIPILAIEHIEGTVPLPSEWAKGEEVFLIKVKGDSMSPFILPNDYVVVRSQPSAENGDVVVTLVGEEATVKRFFKQEERIELRPDNERWETIHIKEGSGGAKVLGKVIGVFRKF